MIGRKGDDRAHARSGGSSRRPRNPAQRGATMLVAAVVVFALGVSVAIAVPVIRNAIRSAQATRFAEELREFSAAFSLHARRHGGWPPGTRAAGEIPAGMRAALGEKWAERSPAGLRYLWAPETLQRGRRYRAAIVLWRERDDPARDERLLLEEIDRQIDDGDLYRGKFQIGYRDQAFYAVDP